MALAGNEGAFGNGLAAGAPDGAPLAGVTVRADGSFAVEVSGDDGSFELSSPPDGSHVLRARGEGRAFPLLTNVESGSEDVVFTALPGRRIGGVLRTRDGRPFPGVLVEASTDPGPDRHEWERAKPPIDYGEDRTDREGRFLIGGLSDRPVLIRLGRRLCHGVGQV